MAHLDELKARLLEVEDLNSAASLARWDQMTYMPVAGAAARARQLALIGRLAHEKLVDPAVGRLLDSLERETASLPVDGDDASLVRVARRRYERALRVPARLVAEVEETAARAYQLWTVARPA